MAEQKDLSSSTLMKTPKSQLTAEQSSTKKTGAYQKRYSTSEDKEEATMRQQEWHFCDIIKSHTHWVGDPQTGK